MVIGLCAGQQHLSKQWAIWSPVGLMYMQWHQGHVTGDKYECFFYTHMAMAVYAADMIGSAGAISCVIGCYLPVGL